MNRTKIVLASAGGFVLGALLTAVIGVKAAPSLMIQESVSAYSFEETVERIETEALDAGWKVPAIHMLSQSVAAGGFDVTPVAVIELCKVELAGQILSGDESRVVSSMMPCRVAVYQTANGEVIVSRMNTELVSRLFGGDIQSVMAEATGETEVILGSVLLQ